MQGARPRIRNVTIATAPKTQNVKLSAFQICWKNAPFLCPLKLAQNKITLILDFYMEYIDIKDSSNVSELLIQRR